MDSVESNQFKDDYPNILSLKCNRDFFNFAKQIQLNNYLKDFFIRMKASKMKQTFKNHFSFSTMIYPFARIDQIFADDLNLLLLIPPESILPHWSSNKHTNYKIHEQIRSKCYFTPQIDYKIEPNDEEYQRKLIELDRTHVVITLENKSKEDELKQPKPIEEKSSCVFISTDSFETGLIRIDQEKMIKQFHPFIYHSTEENQSYFSSTLIQQWFQTLILVNQTCDIAKRFLTGDGSHITCLIKQQTNDTK